MGSPHYTAQHWCPFDDAEGDKSGLRISVIFRALAKTHRPPNHDEPVVANPPIISQSLKCSALKSMLTFGEHCTFDCLEPNIFFSESVKTIVILARTPGNGPITY